MSSQISITVVGAGKYYTYMYVCIIIITIIYSAECNNNSLFCDSGDGDSTVYVCEDET